MKTMHYVWKKRWVNISWVALGAVALVLLGAGVYKKNHKVCNGIEVVFDGDGNNFFIDEKGVEAVLKANGVEAGLPIEKINLRLLESRLKSDQWIANAELYFDNKQVLKAVIQEKEPVARMFTATGSSFYIDSACRRLPLSQKLSARIPMFTGFPSDRQVLSKPDSALLASAKELAMFIQADEFWKAQVSQIDITPEGFEMIPTVGSHIVLLGKDEDYQRKFDRLFSFYKQVWTKVGFETYEKLDVRFEGQVVATLKGTKATQVVDSAKAIATMEKLEADDKPDTVDNANDNHSSAALKDSTVAHAKPSVKANAIVVTNPKQSAAPKPVTVIPKATTLKAAAPKILPKANNKQAVNKKVQDKKLSDEEEIIRKEVMRQLNLRAAAKKVVKPKPTPKAVLSSNVKQQTRNK